MKIVNAWTSILNYIFKQFNGIDTTRAITLVSQIVEHTEIDEHFEKNPKL